MVQQYKPGERIGGEYEVQQVFGGKGQSGMGVVYLVASREISRPIVLKTFQKVESDEAKSRFLSEARAWIKAGAHPNIVQAYWVREIDGQIFVAAEFIEPDDEGRNNLTHFLGAGELRVETCLVWANQFCLGMDYAKSRGLLVHRDIKPDNLMIDREGRLKITDFGLAKAIDWDVLHSQRGPWRLDRKGGAQTSSQTAVGSTMGTPPYMAPEQFVDAKNVDHRADIYSFGIILYEMTTGGGYPYRIRDDATDILFEYFKAHSECAPIPIESPLWSVICRCLEKKPSRRYASYVDLLHDLNSVETTLGIRIPKEVHVAKEDEELYAMAQSYVTLGDKDGALKAIDEYVSKYPNNSCGWNEKGRIHYERGEYTLGLNAIRLSLDLDPYNTRGWNNLGIGLNHTEAPIEEIKKAYYTALHFDPQNTAAIMNLVSPLVLHKEYQEAATLTVVALKLCPDKRLLVQKAESLLAELFQEKEITAAETLLLGWVEARPSDVDPWHNLGCISQSKGDHDRAIQYFEKVHELNTQDNFAVAQLAKLYFQKKKGRECLACCNELLRREYEPTLAVTLKARVGSFMGGYEAALGFLQPYLDHNPENGVLWTTLAEIHEYNDEYGSAIKALERAKMLEESEGGKHSQDNLQILEAKLKHLRAMSGAQPLT